MIITLAAFKGGVAKTTSAIHLAAFLAGRGKTLLIDGDPNRSASSWAGRGKGLPFTVMDERKALDERRVGKKAEVFDHMVIDTEARPSREDLLELAAGCDLLILPTTPDALALDALMLTLSELREGYRILLTIVPPRPSKAGEEARSELVAAKWPVFRTGIRRLTAFQRAAAAGCLVQDVPGDSRAPLGWEDYQAVGRELLRYGKV